MELNRNLVCLELSDAISCIRFIGQNYSFTPTLKIYNLKINGYDLKCVCSNEAKILSNLIDLSIDTILFMCTLT